MKNLVLIGIIAAVLAFAAVGLHASSSDDVIWGKTSGGTKVLIDKQKIVPRALIDKQRVNFGGGSDNWEPQVVCFKDDLTWGKVSFERTLIGTAPMAWW